MLVTALPDNSVNSVLGLSELTSVIKRLTERGTRSQADSNYWKNKNYWETRVYAVPGTSLTVVSLFDHEGGLTFLVLDGGLEVFRLYGPIEFEAAVMADNSVVVYEGVQPMVNELTAVHIDQLQRAIALGV